MNSLLIGDQPMDALKRILALHGVTVSGCVKTAPEALDVVGSLAPDLIFLSAVSSGNLKAPEFSEILKAPHAPLVVVIAENVQHAVDAYALGALDCVLSPVTEARISTTLERAHRRRNGMLMQSVYHEDQAASSPLFTRAGSHLTRLEVRDGSAIRLLRVEQILYIQHNQTTVGRNTVVTIEGNYETKRSLAELSILLPRDRFQRIHSDWVVNVNLIDSRHLEQGEARSAQLSNGLKIPIAGSQYAALMERLTA